VQNNWLLKNNWIKCSETIGGMRERMAAAMHACDVYGMSYAAAALSTTFRFPFTPTWEDVFADEVAFPAVLLIALIRLRNHLQNNTSAASKQASRRMCVT
jgi:hypothetical protein